MYPIQEVARIINLKKIRSVLDIGCRDAILKGYLNKDILYEGNDLFQNATNTVKYVGDILTIEIPQNTYECVTALDVLEHTDNPYAIFDKISKISTNYLIINLPNGYDLKSIFRFVLKGHLGGKYKFDVKNQLDRHRWLMNYKEIENFYKYKAKEHEYLLKIVPLYYGVDKWTFSAIIGKFLTQILPKRLVSSSIIGIFERK